MAVPSVGGWSTSRRRIDMVTETEQEIELINELNKIKWPVKYGSVKVQIREGKPTLVVVENTIKLD